MPLPQFIGPKTQMIKSGVENIYPAEVEGCLKQHPAVADAAARGLITVDAGQVRLTEAGRNQAVELVAVAQSSQMRIESRLAPAEMTMLRHLLQRVVEA